MNALRGAVVCLFITALGCGPVEGIDPVSGEGVEVSREALVADDLYAQLRALENSLPPVPASATLTMGSWTPGGNYVGLGKTCRIVYAPIKHMVCTPATATLNAISAVLRFTVPPGVSLTANGRTVAASIQGVAQIDVGNADVVSWTLRSGTYSYSDTLYIARPDVGGVGAFTIAALPLTIVYEPPQNIARTNSASTSFASETTVVNTITTGNSTSEQPEWAEGEVAKELGVKLAKKFPVTSTAYQALQGVISAWGSVNETVTNNSEVNTDKTLSVKVSATQAIATTSRLGPGRGDLIVFYKDARVAWGMDQGKVSLTLIDHGPLAILSADTLKADLAAVNAGQAAPVSGLDGDTLLELLKLDPMTGMSGPSYLNNLIGGVSLPASRFTDKQTLLLNGTSYTQNVSHTISQSDKVSTSTSTTTVKDYNPGWLTLLGLGQNQAGKVTTKLTFGASRTVTTGETKTASLSLSAGPTESYSVEVNYDNIFGTFLVRTPPTPPIVIGGLTLSK